MKGGTAGAGGGLIAACFTPDGAGATGFSVSRPGGRRGAFFACSSAGVAPRDGPYAKRHLERTLSPSFTNEIRRTDVILASVMDCVAVSDVTWNFVTSVAELECWVFASFLTSSSLSRITSAEASAGVCDPLVAARAVLMMMDFMNALLSLQRGLSLGKSPLRLFLLAPDFGDVDAQFIVVFLRRLSRLFCVRVPIWTY